ncbi:alpha-ketoglutarate-dependent dioxygenase AlkB [Paracoccus pacificus]|uniref:Alpha-ketoglutarate-dependent dioxygenase AlkB n=1 Tax=Paracoccus pacificus TaxID=1463598 RepID=A0ABW4R8G7_9RHOB
MREANTREIRGFVIHPAHLDKAAQTALMEDVAAIWRAAPPVRQMTRWGKPMSVAMSAAGALGWTTDGRGYRYEPKQHDGRPWPPMPRRLEELWRQVTGLDATPDSCLINLYRDTARMGLHQDKDEADFGWPVVSISLGDAALFRIGGARRSDATESLWLHSGDVVVMGGPARLAFHGIDRIRPNSSDLVPGGGRVNLTLRMAGAAV